MIKKQVGAFGKRIKATEDTTQFNLEHPVFCFRYLNKDFHINECIADEQVALLKTLMSLSALTWEQIRQSGRHAMGGEKIDRDSIKSGLPPDAIMTKDQSFIAFRFLGKTPFVGVRNKFVFHIIYIDRSFTLYKH